MCLFLLSLSLLVLVSLCVSIPLSTPCVSLSVSTPLSLSLSFSASLCMFLCLYPPLSFSLPPSLHLSYPLMTDGQAFMSMFQILTQKGWAIVMYECMLAANKALSPVIAIYFIAYHLFATVVNISVTIYFI